MKQIWKRLGSLLLCLAMVLSLLPARAAAEEMVYLIRNEQDFFNIVNNPTANYRLEADLDLHVLPGPISRFPEMATATFTGSLDGNGHTIRYGLRYVEGLTDYSLFGGAVNGAEFTNLTLCPDINLNLPEDSRTYNIAPLCVNGKDFIVTGVEVIGKINVTGGGESTVEVNSLSRGGFACYCSTDVDVWVNVSEYTGVQYLGLNDGRDEDTYRGEAYFCQVNGSVSLVGAVERVYQLSNATDCTTNQEMTVWTAYPWLWLEMDRKGSFNQLQSDVFVGRMDGVEEELAGDVYLLNECVGSSFSGTVSVADCSPVITGAWLCEGVELDCGISTQNSSSAIKGIVDSKDSDYRGSLYGSGENGYVTGLQGSQRCTFEGELLVASEDGGELIGAVHCEDCVIKSNAQINADGDYAFAYGLQECTDSSFEGTLSASNTGGDAHVHGAANSTGCLVIADLIAQGKDPVLGSTVWLVDDDSYYEGMVRASRISGIGSNSAAVADMYAVYSAGIFCGSNSYFSGNLTSQGENCHVELYSIGSAESLCSNTVAQMNISMTAGDASFNSVSRGNNNSFSGNVAISASNHAEIHGPVPATVYNPLVGTWNTAGIPGDPGVVYYHTTALPCDREHSEYVHVYNPADDFVADEHYERMIRVTDRGIANVSPGDASAGWNGSVSPDGSFDFEMESGKKPEQEPSSYILQLQDLTGAPISGVRLLLGGNLYTTDANGQVSFKGDSGEISPLQVQMLNSENLYETVYAREVCYLVPNIVNILRLDLSEHKIEVTIAEEDRFSSDVVCGTLFKEDEPVEYLETVLTLTPKEAFTEVEMCVTLPEGFSFELDELVYEETIPVGVLSEETTVSPPKIYPIYLPDLTDANPRSLAVKITAKDSAGKSIEEESQVDFFVPNDVRDVTPSLGSDIPGTENYIFSLDSAMGSGSAYNSETARLASMRSRMAYNDHYIKNFLIWGMGFSDLDSQNNFTLCGRHFAYKKIIQNGELKNLVYVAIRGTSDGWEAAGDLNLGDSYEHDGFKNAAEYVQEGLNSYCSTHKLTAENTIYLVTGHSKGAGVANILGNWLNHNSKLARKENVSVYTFATPTIDKLIVDEIINVSGNNNIFNFVNYQDAIRNAPSMKYYGRYGKTFYFAFDTAPTGATIHNDGYGTYILPSDGGGFTISELLNGILYETNNTASDIVRALHRVKLLISVVEEIYGGTWKDVVKELKAAHSMSLYYKAVKNGFTSASLAQINARTEEAFAYFIDKTLQVQPVETVINIFKCPINLYVENELGEEVASIVDKQVTCTDENLIVMVQDDALIVGYAEGDADRYAIRVEGYDDGTMTHSVQTVSNDGLEVLTQRKEIPIVKNGTYELEQGIVVTSGETLADAQDAYAKYETEEAMEEALDGLFGTPETPPTEPVYINPFVDVFEVDYYYDPVLWAVNKGITNGLSADTFGPNSTCTRGQIVTFLWRANNSPEPRSSNNPFCDVSSSDYFYKAVLWAVEEGITAGTSATTFSPEAPCTRGQVATFLYRAEKASVSGGSNIFTDITPGTYYYDAVLWAVANGITNGMGEGLFAPENPCTRGQIVTFLHRAMTE